MGKEKRSLADKITEDLREQIIYGSYKPGDTITVRDIAKQYNVSITPVRDAINRLVQSEFLHLIPYQGSRKMIVSNFSRSSFSTNYFNTLIFYAFWLPSCRLING